MRNIRCVHTNLKVEWPPPGPGPFALNRRDSPNHESQFASFIFSYTQSRQLDGWCSISIDISLNSGGGVFISILYLNITRSLYI